MEGGRVDGGLCEGTRQRGWMGGCVREQGSEGGREGGREGGAYRRCAGRGRGSRPKRRRPTKDHLPQGPAGRKGGREGG